MLQKTAVERLSPKLDISAFHDTFSFRTVARSIILPRCTSGRSGVFLCRVHKAFPYPIPQHFAILLASRQAHADAFPQALPTSLPRASFACLSPLKAAKASLPAPTVFLPIVVCGKASSLGETRHSGKSAIMCAGVGKRVERRRCKAKAAFMLSTFSPARSCEKTSASNAKTSGGFPA